MLQITIHPPTYIDTLNKFFIELNEDVIKVSIKDVFSLGMENISKPQIKDFLRNFADRPTGKTERYLFKGIKRNAKPYTLKKSSLLPDSVITQTETISTTQTITTDMKEEVKEMTTPIILHEMNDKTGMNVTDAFAQYNAKSCEEKAEILNNAKENLRKANEQREKEIEEIAYQRKREDLIQEEMETLKKEVKPIQVLVKKEYYVPQPQEATTTETITIQPKKEYKENSSYADKQNELNVLEFIANMKKEQELEEKKEEELEIVTNDVIEEVKEEVTPEFSDDEIKEAMEFAKTLNTYTEEEMLVFSQQFGVPIEIVRQRNGITTETIEEIKEIEKLVIVELEEKEVVEEKQDIHNYINDELMTEYYEIQDCDFNSEDEVIETKQDNISNELYDLEANYEHIKQNYLLNNKSYHEQEKRPKNNDIWEFAEYL